MSLPTKTGRVACWLTTIAFSAAVMGAIMSDSPTPTHRLVKAVSVSFMVLLSGWLWSIQPPAKAST
jgi:hypothetical protein